MKRRFVIYALIGIGFGVFDFYYHAFISNTLFLQQASDFWGRLAWLVLSVGIWLVPVVPIALHEAKVSRSLWLSALASTFTWCASVITYYLNNGVQLAIIGVSSRPELHISNRNDPYFWENWKGVMISDLIGGSIEWIVVAVVGGLAIGFSLSLIYLRLKPIHQGKETTSTEQLW